MPAVNYRHAFHAGNFADCVKHALFVWLLRAMARKPAPFAVLDTHAGTGGYDLSTGPAERTGEWRSGIARLPDAPGPALADYAERVRMLGLYPGSPLIARSVLREADRLICCELHPDDAAALRRRFRGDRQVAIHHRDGWEALVALMPPPERRGLVLIDPPYEEPGEIDRLPTALQAALARFPTGVYAAWYPIKHRLPARRLHAAMRGSGMRDVVAAEFLLREPHDAGRLNGCGLLVVNPPWRFEAEAAPILDALLLHLGDGDPGAATAILRLADE